MDVAKAIVKKHFPRGTNPCATMTGPQSVGNTQIWIDMACFMRNKAPKSDSDGYFSAQVDTKWHVAKVEIHQSWIVQMSPVHLGWNPDI